MCGRVSQRETAEIYAASVGWKQIKGTGPGLKFNVPPGTRPTVLHKLSGSESADRLFWGYKPPWYKRGPASNARLDTVLKGSPFWRPLLAKRILMPCDGWYEWTGEKGDKQPWYINPKDGQPLLMAGITAWTPGKDVLTETGFAIITDDAAGGMVDIHDRRPLCLTLDAAMEWVDPGTSVDGALELLSTPRPESAFQWWAVTRQVGNSRYQGEDSREPISQ